eukprot:CFRG3960T1
MRVHDNMDNPSLADITQKLINDINNIDIERIGAQVDQLITKPHKCKGGKLGCQNGLTCKKSHVRFKSCRLFKVIKETYSPTVHNRTCMANDNSTMKESEDGCVVVEDSSAMARELNVYKTKEMPVRPTSKK